MARATSLTLDIASYFLHVTDCRMIGRVTNVSGGNSGPISLQLYATATRYAGGTLTGYRMAAIPLNALASRDYWSVDNGTVPLTTPPSGVYYATMAVVEGGAVQAYYAWNSPIQFGALRFNNTASWQASGNTVRLFSPDGIGNYSAGGRSSSYRMEFWTFAQPYTGASQPGYLRASYTFPGGLNAGSSLPSFDVTVPLTVPTAGTYYTALILADLSGATPWYSSFVSFPATWVVPPANGPVVAPGIAPDGGVFTSPVTVTLACATAGASIYYTENGATPGTGATLYSGPFTITSSETVKAIGIKSGATSSAVTSAAFVINSPVTVDTPVISPAGGSFSSPRSISLSTTTPGAAIYYTTNGDTPTAAAALYSAPFTLSATAVVKARAFKSGATDSPIAQAAFTITLPVVATPAISPAGGSFSTQANVTLTCATSGAQIYYGLDGALPATVYTGGNLALTSTTTLTAIAKKSGLTDSQIASAGFTILPPAQAVATPTVTPPGGTFAGSVSLTLATTTPGAVIYYSTDGSVPTAGSTPLYAGPFTLSTPGTTTVRAIAFKPGLAASQLLAVDYTITATPVTATPVVTPSGGSFPCSARVTMTCATAGAEIRYTTDGISVPDPNQTLYQRPFTLSQTTPLKVRAFKTGYAPSAVVTVPPLTITACPPDPVLADGAWWVREYRMLSNFALTSIYDAQDVIAGASGTVRTSYTSAVINRSDPDRPGSGGFFPGDLPFAWDNQTLHGLDGLNSGDDDNLVLHARCAIVVTAEDDYTLGFSSDDGAQLRIEGAVFTSSTRLNPGNPANPAHSGNTLSFPGGTPNSDTLGVCHLVPGTYLLDFLTWEGTGGAYCEVFAARGARTALDASFRLVGAQPAGSAGNSSVIAPPGWQVTTLNSGASNFSSALSRVYNWWTGGSTVTAIRFSSANDAPERDPVSYILEGSNSHGTTGPWTLLQSGSTGIPTARNTAGPKITIPNSLPWASYRLRFPEVRAAASANSMQVSEIEFFDASGGLMDLLGGKTAGTTILPSSGNSPPGEGPGQAFDGNRATKYLNFDKTKTGLTIVPGGSNYFWLNFTDPETGGGGHSFISEPFPNNTGGDENNFAVGARATLNIDTPGDYTFCVLADDGFRFRIKGTSGWRVSSTASVQTLPDGMQTENCCTDVFGTVTLAEGNYEIELVYNEISGGANLGVYNAFGSYTAWNPLQFTPLGYNSGTSAPDAVPFTLRLPTAVQPPVNDNFNASSYLDTPECHVAACNTGAILEASEPAAFGMSNTLWWTWVCQTSGPVQVDTTGSDFDTILAIYNLAPLASLIRLATDDQSGGNAASRITFNATAGQFYKIQAGGNGLNST